VLADSLKCKVFVSVAELIEEPESAEEDRGDLAIMLTEAGPRRVSGRSPSRHRRHFPHLRFEIITGVSAVHQRDLSCRKAWITRAAG